MKILIGIMSSKRKFTSIHAKAFSGSGLQFRQNTLLLLDKLLVGVINKFGERCGHFVVQQNKVSMTLMPEHFIGIYPEFNLSSQYLENANKVITTWYNNTLMKQHLAKTEKVRKSKQLSKLAGLNYPVYVEQKKEPKKPGIETLFKDAVCKITQKKIRIHRKVYILVSAIVESIMDSIMHSAAVITKKADRKQITSEHLVQSLEQNSNWDFVKDILS